MTTIKAKDANGQWVRIAGGSFFWRGTKAAYDAIPTKDPAVLYVIEDESTSAWLTDGAADARYVNVAGDTMTGNLTVAPPSGGAFVMSKASAGQSGYFYADGGAGAYAGLQLRSNGSLRWNFVKHNGAESGGNVGSDLWLFRYADDGSQLPTTALQISRATGLITVNGDPVLPNHIATKNYVDNKGVWQAYTPTLTGITLGTGGSVAGRYTRIGNTIHYEVRFSFGAGGSVNEATGKSVSLPVAIRSGSKGLHNAHVGNSAAYFMLNAFIVGGTTAISLNGISADGSASNITNTHPVPIPGSSTSFYVTGTYEAA
jgi:hypothetical protein